MKSRFDSTCAECGDKIERGKEILKNSDGIWVHKHCAEDTIELP